MCVIISIVRVEMRTNELPDAGARPTEFDSAPRSVNGTGRRQSAELPACTLKTDG